MSRLTLPKITGSTIIKLVVASLVVGMVLAFLNIDPVDLLRDFKGTLRSLLKWGADAFGWAFSYILLGAVIVVPIWLAVYLIRMFRDKG